MEQQVDDQHSLVDVILVCLAGLAEDVDHTRLVSELCALVRRL